MATRNDLLNALETALGDGFILDIPGKDRAADGKTHIKEERTSIDGEHVLQMHMVYFWDSEKGAKDNKQFYVVDPDMVNEEALWIRRQDPKQEPPVYFDEEVEAWLRDQIGEQFKDKTMIHFRDLVVDSRAKKAMVNLLLEDNTSVVSFLPVVVIQDKDRWVWREIKDKTIEPAR